MRRFAAQFEICLLIVCRRVQLGVKERVEVKRFEYLRPVLPVAAVPIELREPQLVCIELELADGRSVFKARGTEHIPYGNGVFSVFVLRIHHDDLMLNIDNNVICVRRGIALGKVP